MHKWEINIFVLEISFDFFIYYVLDIKTGITQMTLNYGSEATVAYGYITAYDHIYGLCGYKEK
jgi:hypothetical protein